MKKKILKIKENIKWKARYIILRLKILKIKNNK